MTSLSLFDETNASSTPKAALPPINFFHPNELWACGARRFCPSRCFSVHHHHIIKVEERVQKWKKEYKTGARRRPRVPLSSLSEAKPPSVCGREPEVIGVKESGG